MTMILDSEKLNPQYNQNSVLTMPWIAWGVPAPSPRTPPLATGLKLLMILSYEKMPNNVDDIDFSSFSMFKRTVKCVNFVE